MDLTQPPPALTSRQRIACWIVACVCAATRFLAMARSIWDWDEALFCLALRDYNVVLHHPHPPGFPLFIGAAKLVRLVIGDDFHALRAVSLVASMFVFPALYALARAFGFAFRTSVIAALLFSFLPNVWYWGGTAFSDVFAVALAATFHYGDQSYPVMIDLRERFSKAASRIQDKLSPVSQLVVIYQILREPVAHIPLAQLGKRLAYSPQAVSFAQEELQNSNLCDVRRAGKMVFLEFRLGGKALWEKAEPLMASPVRRTQWVRWGQPRARAVVSGTTALSRLSMLAEDAVPTYGMRDRELVAAFKKGELLGCSGSDDADARMESWKYDPWVLAENGVADPCSLYLSLRRSGDERVQKEIGFLIERLPQ